MRGLTITAAMVVVAAALTGCGTQDGDATAHDARDVAAGVPRIDSGSPSPHSQMPFVCDGATSPKDAFDLIHGGQAIAAAIVTINEDAGPYDERTSSRLVPVSNYKVIAGSLMTDASIVIREVSALGDNILPPGQYVVLLGDDLIKNQFFLSNGVYGSFETDGVTATERCNYDETTGKVELAAGGPMKLDDLADALRPAIVSGSDSSPPTP